MLIYFTIHNFCIETTQNVTIALTAGCLPLTVITVALDVEVKGVEVEAVLLIRRQQI